MSTTEESPVLLDPAPWGDFQQVADWRFDCARRLGASYDLACDFAISRADLGRLRDLVANGCAADTALRILL